MPDTDSLARVMADRLAAWERSRPDRTDQAALALFAGLAATVGQPRPARQDTILGLIRAALAAGHHDAAVAALRAWTSGRETNGAALVLLCAVLLRRGDPDAGEALRRCLAADPTASEGWAEVGDVLVERHKTEAALLCYAKAPPSPALALRAGLIARDLGRRAEALSWFEQLVRLDPSSERGWFLLGALAQDAGRFARACEAYHTVLGLNPGRVEAEVNLGMCLQAAGRLTEAKESYRRAVQARPDTFGRIAQALPGSPTGELWLDLGALRRSLAG